MTHKLAQRFETVKDRYADMLNQKSVTMSEVKSLFMTAIDSQDYLDKLVLDGVIEDVDYQIYNTSIDTIINHMYQLFTKQANNESSTKNEQSQEEESNS